MAIDPAIDPAIDLKIEARWWAKEEKGARCGLCFHRCLVPAGAHGLCGVREYDGKGKNLSSPYLGRFSSCAVDPIEKKPLYHWRPGSKIFSLGSVGCNMRCPFCQNHAISHPAGGTGSVRLLTLEPEELVARVRDMGLSAVAWTYNEPTLQAEYILRAAPLLKKARIAVALVTNGMWGPEFAGELAPLLDAANVDVKTFDAAQYSAMGGSLDVVRENVENLVRAGVHVELTNLVVPGISDSRIGFRTMVDWIAGIGPEIPLHISRYFPAYNHSAPPTDVALMRDFAALAGQKLTHVHLGNV
ncbi:MAG: radical SAM protein [Synergistaceae bacterium]|nr:radical SAM protein [Synergistaceae bacterium]